MMCARVDLLPFTALGWLGLGFIAAGVLRARRPARFEALDRVFLPADDSRRLLRDIECGRGADGITPARVTTFTTAQQAGVATEAVRT
jgi:hypothetical protein